MSSLVLNKTFSEVKTSFLEAEAKRPIQLVILLFLTTYPIHFLASYQKESSS